MNPHPYAQRVGLVVATALVGVAMVPSASAHLVGHDDDLTIHDTGDGVPTRDVADCTFFARFDLDGDEGTVFVNQTFGPRVPEGQGELHLQVPFTAEDRQADGRTLVEITVPERGQFFVDATDGDTLLHSRLFEVHCGEEFAGCFEDVQVETLANGSVRLEWDAAPGARSYVIGRSNTSEHPEALGRFEVFQLANIGSTVYYDEDAPAGVPQLYWIEPQAFEPMEDFEPSSVLDFPRLTCGLVEATAVPFFGAPLMAALALAGAVGAYGWLRRK